MPVLALADALRDFASRTPMAAERGPTPIEVMPAAPTIDIDSIIAAEVEKTEASVSERLSAVYEHTLQAERDNHAVELDRLRAELGGRAGDMISIKLAEAEQRLTELTTGVVSRFLASVASDEFQRKSVQALAKAINDAIADIDAVRIRVSGPASLYEPLRAAIGTRAASFDYRESNAFDLSVDIDGNLYETRLAEWASVVNEVVA